MEDNIKRLEDLIEKEPKMPGNYYKIGIEYSSRKQYDKAIEYYTKAIRRIILISLNTINFPVSYLCIFGFPAF
jgi:tetratricopeptide (TPR) repeat protein